MNNEPTNIDSIAINEAQLILAEKRTSLAIMRTGIAVLALPLTVMSVLIATSKCQMPGHRLPKANGKKCQDIDYPGKIYRPFSACHDVSKKSSWARMGS